MVKKIAILLIVILVTGAGFFIYRSQNKPQAENPANQPSSQLTIVSTKPTPLDEATITPTGDFEITFSKPVSEVKFKTTPENLGIELETVKQTDTEHTFKFKFKESLNLGTGVTIFILTNTRSKDGQDLDKEYVYHLKTISYKGV